MKETEAIILRHKLSQRNEKAGGLKDHTGSPYSKREASICGDSKETRSVKRPLKIEVS
jgi:hypothetical protein